MARLCTKPDEIGTARSGPQRSGSPASGFRSFTRFFAHHNRLTVTGRFRTWYDQRSSIARRLRASSPNGAQSEAHNRQLAFMLDTESEYWQNIDCHCDQSNLLGHRESSPTRNERTKASWSMRVFFDTQADEEGRPGHTTWQSSLKRRSTDVQLCDLHPTP